MSKYQRVLKNNIPSDNGELDSGACVWLYKKTETGVLILFQKRSASIANGGFYDISAGGHIDFGEEPLPAAIREAREEIGIDLDPNELEFLCTYRTANKIVSIYLADRTGKNDVFTLNPDEVDSVKWVALEDCDDFIAKNVKPNLRTDYPHFELLKKRLKNGSF